MDRATLKHFLQEKYEKDIHGHGSNCSPESKNYNVDFVHFTFTVLLPHVFITKCEKKLWTLNISLIQTTKNMQNFPISMRDGETSCRL
jgi:hypothetical protein